MATVAELNVAITADSTGLQSGLNRAEQTISQTVKNMGRSLTAVGVGMTAAITAPLALLGAGIMKVGQDYERAMNIFQAVTRASGDEMERASKLAEELGADMQLPATSAGDAAKAMTELAKGGLTASQAMDAARGTLQLAAAAGVDEARAAEIAANALNAFGLAASEAGRISDLLAGAANASSAEIDDVALSMQQASAVFSAAHVPIEDLVTAIAEMANAGIKGSDAGTSLKTMMIALEAPTKKAAEEMKRLHINIFDAQGSFLPFREMIAQVENALKGMSDQQQAAALKIIFGTDAIRAANIVMVKGVEQFDKMAEAVNRTGAAQELSAARAKGLSGALDGLNSQLETLGLQIYKSVSPALESMVRMLADLIGNIGQADKAVLQAGVTMGAVFAATGPIVLGIGLVVSLLGGPLTLAIAGVTAAVAVLAAEWVLDMGKVGGSSAITAADVKQKFLDMAIAIGHALDTVSFAANLVMATIKALGSIILFATTPILTVMFAMEDGIKGAVKRMATYWDNMNASFERSTNAMAAAIEGRWSGMLGNLVRGINNVNNIARAWGESQKSFELRTKIQWDKASSTNVEKEIKDAMGRIGKIAGDGGKGVTKALFDGFKDGLEGLQAAFAFVGQQSTLGKLDNLFDAVSGKARAGMDKTVKALEAGSKAINDFLDFVGIKAKVTAEELAKHFDEMSDTIKRTLVFKQLQADINAINIDRVNQGLLTLNDTFTLHGKTIDIDISMLNALKAKYPELTIQISGANLALRGLFPAIEATDVSFKGLFENLSAGNSIISETADQVERASTIWIKSLDDVKRALPAFQQALQDIKRSIEASFSFDTQKLTNEAGQAIESIINEFEQGAARLGLTNDAMIQYVLNGIRSIFGPQFTGLFKEIGDQTVKIWADSLNRLPGSLDSIVNKMLDAFGKFAAESRIKIKGAFSDIFQIIDSLPGRIGDALRKGTREFERWVATINGILGLLHRIFNSIPANIGDVMSQVVGIFKKAQTSISDSLDAIQKRAKAAAQGTSSATAGIATAATQNAGKFKIAFSAMEGALASFATAVAVTAGTGSKTMGFLSSLVSSTLAGVQAGLAFGPVGGAIVGGISLIGGLLGSLFGGKSALQKAQEAAALQKAKDEIKLSQQAVLQAFEATKQSIIETASKARDLLEAITFYTQVPKDSFKAFFRDLDRLMERFAESAKEWMTDASGKIKVFSEDMQLVLEGIASAPTALTGIGRYLGVTESAIDQFFSDLGKVLVAFEKLGEDFTRKFLRHTRQFAERIETAVKLIPDITTGIVGLVDIKPIPAEALDIWEDSLHQLVDRIGKLTTFFDKTLVKQIGFFAQQIEPAVTLWRDATDAIKSMLEFSLRPSPDAFAFLFDSIKRALEGFSDLTKTLSTDTLLKAQDIAASSMVIFDAIKAAVEAFEGLRNYKSVAQEAIDAIVEDFKRALILLNLLILDATIFEDKTKTFESIVLSGAKHLSGGVKAFVDSITGAAISLRDLPQGGTPLPQTAAGTTGGFGIASRTGASAPVTIQFGGISIAPSDPKGAAAYQKVIELLRILGVDIPQLIRAGGLTA